jgi:isopropylmalate/homocitrate/citramalate synthase
MSDTINIPVIITDVTLSDLQGVADEKATRRILVAILERRQGREPGKIGYHPHNVSGRAAVSNSLAAYNPGIRPFDASLGGTGGCVTGAPGNQPTEERVWASEAPGIGTGLDMEALSSVAAFIQRALFDRIPLPGPASL